MRGFSSFRGTALADVVHSRARHSVVRLLPPRQRGQSELVRAGASGAAVGPRSCATKHEPAHLLHWPVRSKFALLAISYGAHLCGTRALGRLGSALLTRVQTVCSTLDRVRRALRTVSREQARAGAAAECRSRLPGGFQLPVRVRRCNLLRRDGHHLGQERSPGGQAASARTAARSTHDESVKAAPSAPPAIRTQASATRTPSRGASSSAT